MASRSKHSAVVVRLKRRKAFKDPRETAFNTAFGIRLKAAREAIDHSQTRLAERLGIGYDAYKKYEYGSRAFPLYLLRELSSILDKPVSWLLTGH